MIQMGHVVMGQNGRHFRWGDVAFTTTATTATFRVDLKVVEAVYFFPSGPHASDERFHCADLADGAAKVPTSGLLTITREGGPTSGLRGSVLVIGY